MHVFFERLRIIIKHYVFYVDIQMFTKGDCKSVKTKRSSTQARGNSLIIEWSGKSIEIEPLFPFNFIITLTHVYFLVIFRNRSICFSFRYHQATCIINVRDNRMEQFRMNNLETQATLGTRQRTKTINKHRKLKRWVTRTPLYNDTIQQWILELFWQCCIFVLFIVFITGLFSISQDWKTDALESILRVYIFLTSNCFFNFFEGMCLLFVVTF